MLTTEIFYLFFFKCDLFRIVIELLTIKTKSFHFTFLIENKDASINYLSQYS